MQAQGEGSSGTLFYKYSKISQQQKFHLVSLVVRERRSIKEAARVVGINYSTAKTIIFFHRNHLKSYQFDLSRSRARRPAAYRDIPERLDAAPAFQPVQLVCSLGSKVANFDFNSLQTRLLGNRLDHAGGGPGGAVGAESDSPGQICQCERRQTRAQSAKQAAKLTFSPPATKQEQSCQEASQEPKSYLENSEQHKKQ